MIRRLLLRAAVLLGILAAVGLALAAVLIATPLGTRWIVAGVEWAAGDAIDIEAPGGTVVSALEFGAIRVPSDGGTIIAERVALRLDLAALLAGEAHLEGLTANTVTVRIGGRESEDSDSGEPAWPEAPLPLSIDSIDITALTLALDGGEQTVSVRGALAWQGAALSISDLTVARDDSTVTGDVALTLAPDGPLAAELRWRTIEPLPEANGDLTVDGTLARVAVEHTLRSPLTLTTRGSVAVADAMTFDLVHDWPQQTLAAVGWPAFTAGDGELSTRGTPDRVVWSIDAAVTRADAFTTVMRGEGVLTPTALTIEQLLIEDPAADARLAGTVAYAGENPTASLDVTGDVRGLPDADVALPLPLGIDAALTASWTEAGGAVAELVLTAPDDAAATLAGRVTVDGDVIAASNLVLALGGDRLEATGSLSPRTVDAAVGWRFADIAAYRPGIGGALTGNARISGTPERPAIELEARVDSLETDALTAATGVVTVSADQTLRGSARAEFEGLAVAGRPIGAWSLSLDGDPASHTWQVDAENTDLRLTAGATAQAADDAYRLRWTTFDVTERALGTWRLASTGAELSISAAGIVLDELCIAGGGSACVQGRFVAGAGEGDATLALSAVPIGDATRWLSPELDVAGELDANVSGQWRAGQVDGDARATVSNGELRLLEASSANDAATLAFGVELAATVANSRVGLTASLDVPDTGGWRASGSIADVTDPDTPIELESFASFPDVAILDPWVSFARLTAGTASVAVDVAGTLSAPAATVRLELDAFDARVAETGMPVSDVDATISGSTTAGWRVDARIDAGGGTLAATGDLAWPHADGWAGELAVDGESITLADLPEFRFVVSPSMRITRRDARLVIGGKVHVPEALLSPVEVPPEAVLPSDDVVLHTAQGAGAQDPRSRTELDLRVTLGDSVMLVGYGLRSRLAGALRLDGRLPDGVRAFGNLRLVDGSFEAYGQALTIDQGELIFGGDPANPGLAILATRAVDPGVVGLRVSGTVREPVSTLTSTPTLPQAETLAWLLTGRGLEASDTAQDDLLSKAAIGLGLTRLGIVTEQLRESLGLDTLSVDGGADDGQLLAGKWIGERLYLQYAVGIFDKIGSVLIRYSISDHLRFESRTGTEQSVDVVYTVERD